jgi:DNA-directed RNA polymerase specialized sigma24 family protein
MRAGVITRLRTEPMAQFDSDGDRQKDRTDDSAQPHSVPSIRPRNPEEFVFFESELPALDVRQRTVLRLRAGLVDGHRYTLEEVGAVFGISPGRSRQIQQAALLACRKQRSALPRPNCRAAAPTDSTLDEHPDPLSRRAALPAGLASSV